MKKYEYLKKIYDSDSSVDFELAKLGLMGWVMCGCVRHNPSPARVQFIVWYVREIPKSRQEKPLPADTFGLFAPEVESIGDIVPKISTDPSQPSPIEWPEFDPDINPFEEDDE